MSPPQEKHPGANRGESDDQAGGQVESIVAQPSDETPLLNLAGCFDLLGIADDELLSVLSKQAGQTEAVGKQAPAGAVRALGAVLPDWADYWAGLCPMREAQSGRGKAADVIRVPALFADLDVGPGKLATIEDCWAVVDALSAMLGQNPAYVTMSGHGLQPVWLVEPEDSTDIELMAGLLLDFGKLVKHVARKHGGTADSVFDLARVLRAPGSTNLKDPANPVLVTATATGGAPLSAEQIREAIDTYLPVDEQGDAKPDDKVNPTEGQRETSKYWTDGKYSCTAVSKALGKALGELRDSRHPNARKGITALTRLGEQGHEGVGTAITTLLGAFHAEVTAKGQGRDSRGAYAEWDALVSGVDELIGKKLTPESDKGCCADAPSSQGYTGGLPGAEYVPEGEAIPEGEPTAPANPEDQGASNKTTPKRRLKLTAASDIEPERVRWFWDGRMALGALSLIAGPEGLGKSTLTYWIVAQVTRGTLPGEMFGTPKSVLIAATEDSWSHTIVPRLIAAGADLKRVYRVDATTTLGFEGELVLPADIPAMAEAAEQVDAALLVLDPLTSRLSTGLDTHKDSETRQALEPLVKFASASRIAVIGIMHFNKSGSTDPLSLVMASKAFTAVARSVSTVVKDPDDETEAARLFGTVKNNLGRADLPLLRFTITGHAVPTADGDAWTGKLKWGVDAEGTITDALHRATETGGDKSATAEASDWLNDYIESQGGVADSADAKRAGHKAGHTNDALKRACKRLGVTIESHGFPRKTRWILPVGAQSAHIPRGDHSTTPTAPTGGKDSQSVQSVQSVQLAGTGVDCAPTSGQTQSERQKGLLDMLNPCDLCGVETVSQPCRDCQVALDIEAQDAEWIKAQREYTEATA